MSLKLLVILKKTLPLQNAIKCFPFTQFLGLGLKYTLHLKNPSLTTRPLGI